jgi:hypothetical protein
MLTMIVCCNIVFLASTGAAHGNLGPLESFLGYYLNTVGGE